MLYEMSAAYGDAHALYNLALCYQVSGCSVLLVWFFYPSDIIQDGIGVAQDLTKAVFYYRKSVELGDAAAQCNLGYCFENGSALLCTKTKAQTHIYPSIQGWAYRRIWPWPSTGTDSRPRKGSYMHSSTSRSSSCAAKR
jgi:TPR repeat protein